MTVIAVCNQKGGSGKTTLAINLAGAFAADGMGVLLLDMDPQGSALDWGSIQPAFPPLFEVMEMDRPQLLRQARGLRREYEVIVIDCPAKFADSSSAAIRVADLVLVPVQPSPFDVWASDAIAGLVKTRQEANGGTPLAACVISRAITTPPCSAPLEPPWRAMGCRCCGQAPRKEWLTPRLWPKGRPCSREGAQLPAKRWNRSGTRSRR